MRAATFANGNVVRVSTPASGPSLSAGRLYWASARSRVREWHVSALDKEADTQRHYFERPGNIYVDKVSKFACKLIRETGGKPVDRLAQIVDRIYIDEAQDLAGYDLDLIEHLLDSNIEVVLVGDHRQATFKTNQSGKNRKFGRQRIIDKFAEWQAEAGQR